MDDENQDWLNGNDEEYRRDLKNKEIDFAKNYEVFVTDPRGATLLKHWDTVYRRKRTPVDASVQVYAADAAVREFIQGIFDQIDKAKERDL